MKPKDKLFDLLNYLPSWYSSLILSIHVDSMSLSTKIGYSRDVITFFEYMRENNPALKTKETKDFSIDDISMITPQDANEYALSLGDLSASTLSRRLAAVSSMYVELMRYNQVTSNPFLVVRRPKQKKNVIIYLTDNEEKRFMSVIQSGEGLTNRELIYHDPIRDTALFSLFLDTGLRLSEVCNVTFSDIDLSSASVVVTRKGGNHEEVFFSDNTVNKIKEYIEIKNKPHTSEDALFTNSRGTSLSPRSIEYLVEKYAKIAFPNKHISPHKLRSSFAMHFYAKTHDLLLLKDKLGHSSIQTTTIYADAVKERLRDTRNIFND